MSVRFKFRSSVNFDSVDIDNKPFISVRDLRSKIMDQKNLKICQDFDLVISAADTGEEYEDENFLVPSGSSVIIKRVPAGRSAPSVVSFSVFILVDIFILQNVEVENFDDFGIDLFPAPETSLFDSDTDDDKVNYASKGQADKEILRYTGPSMVRHQNHEPRKPSEGIPKGVTDFGFDGDTLQVKLKPKMEEQKKLDGVVNASLPAIAKTDLPSELRCSLCNTIFKEAVMIPCCQHSFCDKCIRLVLVENARQAIEHFLESQGLISGSDNILPKYAPDGESGIQAKEFSCAVSIRQREPLLPHSPSATGKGSNQVMTESAYESTFRNGGSAAGTSFRINLDAGKRSASSSQKINQIRNGERDAVACPANLKGVPEGFTPVSEFEGENQPSKLPTSLMQEEVRKRKGLWLNTADGAGSFAATSRHRKGDRTCYMCGSPDHLIRDCPAASSQYPMLQTGEAVFPGGMPTYGAPYWPGTSLPHMRPYANVYATPGMMPFDPNMVAVNPFTVPSYMPPMYAGMPVPYGLMRMGGLAPPMMTGVERPFMQAEFMDLQGSEQKHKHFNGHLEREKIHDADNSDEEYRYNEPQRSHDRKPQLDREHNGSYSEDSDIQISQRKHVRDKHPDQEARLIDRRYEKGSHSSAAGRDRREHHLDGSSSEMQGTSNNSNRHSKDSRHRHHQRSSKKHSERKGECVSDSSRRSRHQSHKEATIDRKRVEPDVKRHSRRYHSHTESGPEPSSSGDRNKQRREKESSHSSRHSQHKLKPTDDQLHNERWEMIDGLDDNCREEYHHHHHHHHKRKRVH
ncbi:zinc finger protein [Macleaya cordata]|uniref:Zinc finger protein n=1 Tax=Macleaya cordata TaxID=56857 RepID=A0A200QD14_MACCD|nr:zinc finger protein [Macleaya cordata]